jgi:GrpB-like predicted nucleotidyltransferase (UPF0157 family)
VRPSNAEIVRHHDDEPPDGASPYVGRYRPPPFTVEIVEYDDAWPLAYARLAARILGALPGEVLVGLDHVGSTAVPGLPAKPVIDIDLAVADSAREDSYVPALEAVGFQHVIREPWWHEHRVLKHDSPRAHLHVFSPGSPEVVRHRMFRDWLVEHAEDRVLYAEAKRSAAAASNGAGGTVQDYNALKQPVLREIYDRMFRVHGLL